jgi:septal ring factor EnvC (AmiA/AmiB activator)
LNVLLISGRVIIADAQKLEQKKRELATLKSNITRRKDEISKSQRELTDLNKKFSLLDGTLGNFEGIWMKVSTLLDHLPIPYSEQDNGIAHKRCESA